MSAPVSTLPPAINRPGSRRGFLRGLASLPLIGGAMALIGAPVAVAEPRTREQLTRYLAWLANEHAAALLELRYGLGDSSDVDWIGDHAGWASNRLETPLYWFPDAPDVERAVIAARPSTRAAIVMAAVGCDGRIGNV